VTDDTEWNLRYAPEQANLFHAAIIVSAYASLVDPSITQAQAIDMLKRARRAVAAVEGTETKEGGDE
jgi:hypothetical protein